ncbi:iduronate-2-sulfatase, partial [Verrucomicrobia bacterium]|nr:iduronate-2-sulfatase [Verrucomicrobiota bacterium]
MQMPACMASNVAQAGSTDRPPNVILIICDDLNDYVEGYGGHPQARTPEITRLIQSGVL